MHFEHYDNERLKAQLSGERFTVTYELTGTEAECRTIANEICVEQSIEFPVAATPAGDIIDQIVGRIEEFTQTAENTWRADISFAVENTAGEFTQFLNVLMGNFSIKLNARIIDLQLSPSVLALTKGPRFGIDGIRELVGEPELPLLMTALKPMGMAPSDLGELAYTFAANGLQVIKDDHGLSDQVYAPFEDRVKACCEGVKRAYEETGNRCLYVPNVTGPAEVLRDRARFAVEQGAGGIMVAPGLIGLDMMRSLAEDDAIGVPVFSHPAFGGCYYINRQTFSIEMFNGLITRLAGADAVIFPNYGGRFAFTKEECLGIAREGKRDLGGMKTLFPCPSGGMQIDRIGDMLETYSRDIMLLIGGGLFTYGPDLAENCRAFRDAMYRACGRE